MQAANATPLPQSESTALQPVPVVAELPVGVIADQQDLEEDRQLIELFQRGTPDERTEAIGAIYDKNHRRLYGFLCSAWPAITVEDRDDIFMQTWNVALSGGLDRFEWRDKPIISWLIAVADHLCSKHWHESKKETLMDPLEEEQHGWGQALFPAVLDDDTSTVQERKQKQLLRRAKDLVLPKLTPRQRAVVEHAAEGFNSTQIGKLLGIADGTVRVHLHNARKKAEETLREVLECEDHSRKVRDGH